MWETPAMPVPGHHLVDAVGSGVVEHDVNVGHDVGLDAAPIFAGVYCH
ncbi:hypothetical protein [Pseudofrankia asymbiotica]|nr:hypothetical protein [Pseudofrankia asymbiotica]